MSNNLIHDAYIEYQEMIAEHPNYQGMPDLRNNDGSVQWEAPSNRGSGKHADTYTRRLEWWRSKAQQHNISTESTRWISKTAKLIHPTKRKPCKVCGHYMDIRYVYPNKRTQKKIAIYPELGEILSDRFATIFDLANAIYELVNQPHQCLQSILKCKSFPKIPHFATYEEFEMWVETVYVPAEPSTFSPGAMSNAPDRLDGFHSFNLCCRGRSDKGRSSQNLASYATDRRAFENWSAGNFVTANMLMGEIRRNQTIQSIGCANSPVDKPHTDVISADHIGPISLGFAHRPFFRLLCTACNSGKNNRMTFQDIIDLRSAKDDGEVISTWYNEPLWSLYSPQVNSDIEADVMTKLLRDNRSIAFELLGSLLRENLLFPMATLLNPNFAAKKWNLDTFQIANHTITGVFSSSPSTAKFRSKQQSRLLRVSFEAIGEYLSKDNRNVVSKFDDVTIPEVDSVLAVTREFASAFDEERVLIENFFSTSHPTPSQVENLVTSIEEAKQTAIHNDFVSFITSYMHDAATELVLSSDSYRYTRGPIDIAQPIHPVIRER